MTEAEEFKELTDTTAAKEGIAPAVVEVERFGYSALEANMRVVIYRDKLRQVQVSRSLQDSEVLREAWAKPGA